MSNEFKPPKGTRDYDSNLESCRERIVDICKKTFALYGAQPMQTPVFEIKQLLMDKYGGDDSDKQVYELNEDNVVNQISMLKNY